MAPRSGGGLGLIAVQIGGSQWLRHRSRLPNEWTQIPIEAGKAASSYVEPGSLIVVRSSEPTYDDYWRTANNYEDPTIFYVTHTRGWEIGNEIADTALVRNFASRGAKLLVESRPRHAAERAQPVARARSGAARDHTTRLQSLAPGQLDPAPGRAGRLFRHLAGLPMQLTSKACLIEFARRCFPTV